MAYLLYLLAFVVVAACAFYIFGYAYLFSGISKTYLRGKMSANIDDGILFKSNIIRKGTQKAWKEHPDFNKKELPEVVKQDVLSMLSACLF